VNVRRNSRSVRKDIRGDQSPLHLPEPQDFKKKMAQNTTMAEGLTGRVEIKEEGKRNRGADHPRRPSLTQPSMPSVQVPGEINLKSNKTKGNGKPSPGVAPQIKNSKKRQVPQNKLRASFSAVSSVDTTQAPTPTPAQKTLQGHERVREVSNTSTTPHNTNPDIIQRGHAAHANRGHQNLDGKKGEANLKKGQDVKVRPSLSYPLTRATLANFEDRAVHYARSAPSRDRRGRYTNRSNRREANGQNEPLDPLGAAQKAKPPEALSSGTFLHPTVGLSKENGTFPDTSLVARATSNIKRDLSTALDAADTPVSVAGTRSTRQTVVLDSYLPTEEEIESNDTGAASIFKQENTSDRPHRPPTATQATAEIRTDRTAHGQTQAGEIDLQKMCKCVCISVLFP